MESYLTAEISAAAVRHNLATLRARLTRQARICAVVKADCYGHGQDLLLDVISRGADCLGVATPEEAIHLRRMGYKRPIHTFFSACAYSDGHELFDALDELVVQNVTLTVVAADEVQAVAESAARVGARARVHVKVDTGMGRSGVPWGAAAALVDAVRRCPNVQLTGMYTHFAVADEADKQYTRQQLANFMLATRTCGASGITLHAANSAAMIDLPETHLDMARPGIAIYGYQCSDKMHTRLDLRPALRLWGRLMQIKEVPAGSQCGYGLTHTFTRPSRCGLVPVGYGDGYMRSLSNKSVMKIRGRYVKTCGNVSMDQVIVDITDLSDARIGDEVEIISNQPDAPNSVENLAALAGTIPYEITCRLGRRVRRVLVDQAAPADQSVHGESRADTTCAQTTRRVTRAAAN